MKRVLLCCIGVAGLACGPVGEVPTAVDTMSPKAASPTPSPSPSTSVEVLAVTYLNPGETIDLVTVSNGSATTRRLIDHQPIALLAANQRVALIATNNYAQFATLDIDTGAVRTFDVTSANGLWAALSPDGRQAAVRVLDADLQNYEILIVDLGSGAIRHLLQVPRSAYDRAGLDPLFWSASGILVSPGVWDCFRNGLLFLDPQSGKLTPLADGIVGVFSPDGSWMASSSYASLGDGPYAGQCGWLNQLRAGPIGPPLAMIAQHQNRDFLALDVTNDGHVLYRVDDAPLVGSATAPAPDMGLYVEAGGQITQQLGEEHVSQWGAGKLIDPGTALVAKIVNRGNSGSVEIDLLKLCFATDCTTTPQPVASISGAYPSPSLIVLRDPAST